MPPSGTDRLVFDTVNPGASSSASVAVTLAMARPLKSESVLVAVWVKVAVPFVSSLSSAADTVTVCAVLQLVAPKTSDAGLTVRLPSPPVCFATAMVTPAAGAPSSTTVQVAEPPSGTLRLFFDTVTPRSSSSSVAATPAITRLLP